MANCTSCGADVTGKKFCPECGTPVQPAATPLASSQPALATTCPRCNGEVTPGTAFCMHCGSSLSAPAMAATATPAPPATRPCPSCRTEVHVENPFCPNCGQNMRVSAAPAHCTNCGHQNAPGVHFCTSCGKPLTAMTAPPPMAQQAYTQQGPYGQQPPQPYSQPQYPQPPPQYGQPQYPQQPPQYGQPQYPQQQPQYGQPQYPQQQPQYGQMGYQQDPMLGQQPMVLHCPTCMTISQVGTPNCPRCHTNLAGVVPTPAQAQQGGIAGFLQGGAGKMAMGALGGAGAVIGGEMLLHGLENVIENRVEGDMGFGGGGEYEGEHHRHHHHREYDDN